MFHVNCSIIQSIQECTNCTTMFSLPSLFPILILSSLFIVVLCFFLYSSPSFTHSLEEYKWRYGGWRLWWREQAVVSIHPPSSHLFPPCWTRWGGGGGIRCIFEAESRRLKLAACSQFTKRNEFILETCFLVPSCKYAVALLFLG